jgi:hypothetical protein
MRRRKRMKKPREPYKSRLLRLADRIESDWAHFDMRNWVSRKDPKKLLTEMERQRDEVEYEGYHVRSIVKPVLKLMQTLENNGKDGKPWCGSALCIVGYACFDNQEALAKLRTKPTNWRELGAKILGLGNNISYRLFAEHNWPDWALAKIIAAKFKYKTQPPIDRAKAKVAAELLRMIASGTDPWEVK